MAIMIGLDKVVKIDPSDSQTFWYASLRNWTKAPNTTQKVAALVLNFFTLGIPYFFMKSWTLVKEGNIHLLNPDPKEVKRIESWSLGIQASEVDKLFVLELLYVINRPKFMEDLEKMYHKYKNFHPHLDFSKQDIQELRRMKKFYDVLRIRKSREGFLDHIMLENIEKGEFLHIWKALKSPNLTSII